MNVQTIAELKSKGQSAEYLFWVGCAGSFDDRAKKITIALTKVLQKANVSFAILGTEERCTGDPAKRSGNEFLFQMTAMQNIQTMNDYNITKIITICPHCMNTLKNEYSELGGNYEVLHYTEFVLHLIETGKLTLNENALQGELIAYHDPCYLGRANGVYDAPRMLIERLKGEVVEFNRNKRNSFCCGAGGAQIFKEAEPGKKEVHTERTEEAIATKATTIAVGCPFCKLMIADGLKELKSDATVMDISELIVLALETSL